VSESKITDQLSEIIEASRLTPYEIAKTAGLSPSTATRFLSGERSTLDLLAGALGLKIAGKAPADGEEGQIRLQGMTAGGGCRGH
jgi:transcriptional regulator with XRE-family HTH domain